MASAQLVVLFGLKDLGTPLCGLLPGGLVITSPQHLGQDRADFSTDPLAFWAFSDAGTHGAIVRYDCPLFGWNRVDFPKTEHKMQDGGGISQNRPFSQATEHGYVFDRIRRRSTASRSRMMPSQKSLELIARPRAARGNRGEHIGASRIPMDYPCCSRQPLYQFRRIAKERNSDPSTGLKGSP